MAQSLGLIRLGLQFAKTSELILKDSSTPSIIFFTWQKNREELDFVGMLGREPLEQRKREFQLYTGKDFELIVNRIARMNLEFLHNAFNIKDEFLEIIEFIELHKYEFQLNSSFYFSGREVTDFEALVIEKLFRDIFSFTLEFIEPDENLSSEEIKGIYEEVGILEFLDNWYKNQGIKN
jgi:hypothetical protein